MYSCHSILECYNLFSGVKLSIRSFCFIIKFIDFALREPREKAALCTVSLP